MSEPRGTMWVNTDGMLALGASYEEHAATYQHYLALLEEMEARFAAACGNDDIGADFLAKLKAGLEQLRGIVRYLEGLLRYVSAGLTSGARAYTKADEDAGDASFALERNFDARLHPSGAAGHPTTEAKPRCARPCGRSIPRSHRQLYRPARSCMATTRAHPTSPRSRAS